jgi:hypothetical protein
VLEVVKKVYPVGNQKPCLLERGSEKTEGLSESTNSERERRSEKRALYRELSRYYAGPEVLWTKAELLSAGKHGRLQSTGDAQFTYFPISRRGFGETLQSPRKPRAPGAPEPTGKGWLDGTHVQVPQGFYWELLKTGHPCYE